MPDMSFNFMSYSGPCTNFFTEGQAAKMRSVLTVQRYGLLEQNNCNPPCTENLMAYFTRDNWLPSPGQMIHFDAGSSTGTNFQWSVDGTIVGSNSPLYMQSFSAQGKYKVMLKVFNANNACFASYSDDVIVGCGLISRFTPNKRLIASKDQIETDTIYFKNLSVNANSYQWWISNGTGMSPQIISNNFNLNQIFHEPGNYSVWLVASNGICQDTTEKFNFTVNDPTADGTVGLQEVECYERTKILVKFSVCNYGYVAIPAGTPVSFYDGDPVTGAGKRLGPAFIMPTSVEGNCCSSFSIILDIGTPGLNQLYAVFNDNGNTHPLVLPNSSLVESTYTNNIASAKDFQFKASVDPADSLLKPGDTLQLHGHGGPGMVSSYLWSSASELSCTDCADPVFIANKNDVTERLIVTSKYGCVDSADAVIKILPPDFTTRILETHCYSNDSLLVKFSICMNNGYDSLFPGIPVSFYDGADKNSYKLLEPVFYTDKLIPGNCDSFSTRIRVPISGNLTGVVNDKGSNSSNSTDTAFTESDYSNNISSIAVIPFSVSVHPDDTTVNRNTPVPLQIETSGGKASSYTWYPSDFITCANCPDPVVTPPHSVQYEIEVQNEFTCTAKAKVKINTFTGGRVNIPNAFTPNGDGLNDIFYIMGGQDIKIIKEFSIFNRWGQPVFSKTNIQANDSGSGWNGLVNGKPAPAGAYVYIAVIEFSDGSQQVYKGSLVVVL
jgi:gliding motility-associated-like protein